MKGKNNFFRRQSCRVIIFGVAVLGMLLPTFIHATEAKEASKTQWVNRPEPAEINVNRSSLNYGAVSEGGGTLYYSGTQDFLISNSGGGTLNWQITDDQDWLVCTPNYGTGNGTVKVQVAPCELPYGTYTGTITISDSVDPAVTPKTLPVNLNVIPPSQDQPPFGSFDTPAHNSTVRSSIPVTGWVLDDVKVDNVKIYNGSSYVGDALLVEGARPDIEQQYSDTPINYNAGWGYMMLTNFLPGGGNGTYNITAIATDNGGNQTTLGTKTIYCDNEHAVKPFGAIDAPAAGGVASGSSYSNAGWALTPQPNYIPSDGSTINVYVDGVNKGHPKYGIPRSDISQLFPDYENADGSGALYQLDTTGYADGVYTIYWTATDTAGNTDGIGSRYFSINNIENREKNSQQANPASATAKSPHFPTRCFSRLEQLRDMDYVQGLRIKQGFEQDAALLEKYPDREGIILIELKELERLELDFSGHLARDSQLSAYLVVGNALRSLPIGSTLDSGKHKYYWIPGLGFIGQYNFVFIEHNQEGAVRLLKVIVKIRPKY